VTRSPRLSNSKQLVIFLYSLYNGENVDSPLVGMLYCDIITLTSRMQFRPVKACLHA